MRKMMSVVAILLLASTAVMADEKVGDISHEELVKAVKDGKVVLIDVNGTETYKKGHIPGAINFEADGAELAKKLPEDKNTLIVAYCGSEKCNAYKKGAEAALKLGYTNVKHYKGGLAGWEKSGEKLEVASK